ncbi:hypothetical protein ACOSP7_023224 [Xanthoceras sorbifolium]|uniref:Glycine-rich protein n=1 Tax=Xanthoceras sorbifolium TaxID=99658 RepID=A0ABQ8HQM2_9ROSI|nr:hypothetical protein JRO89_XS08G0207300 [Xanthoceras sorbifolium]
MAAILKSSLGLLFILLLLINSTFIIETEARPFNIMVPQINFPSNEELDGFFSGLSLGAMKQSGPSPGEGHKFTDSLGGIKESGPSPGEGHKFTDSLGGIKESGPSPGEGHKFTDSLGGIKESGPSPRGEGH